MYTRIELTNYRIHADSAIDLGATMTILSGPNQAGKTSFRLALEAALTTRNELTDGRGSGMKEQLRRGQTSGRIAVISDDEHIRMDLLTGKREGTSSCVVRNHPEVLHACLQQGWFLGLPEKEQRRFLADALGLGADLTWPEWRDALNAWTPEFPDLGNWMGRETLPGLRRADLYKWAYDERTAVNAVIKRMEAELDAQPPPVPGTERIDVEKLRGLLGELSARLSEMTAQRSSARQTYDAKMSAFQSQQRIHDDLARRVADAQKAVEDAANAAIASNGKIGKGAKSPSKLSAALTDAVNVLESAIRDENETRKNLDAMASSSGACPAGFCARVAMEYLINTLREHSSAVQGAREKLAQAQARVAESDRITHEADMMARRSAEAEAVVRGLLAEQSALDPLPPMPSLMADEGFDTLIADITTQRDQVQQKLAAAERVHYEHEARAQAIARRAEVEQELESLRDRARRLAALVDAKTGALVESGIIDRKWRSNLTAFVADWNEALKTSGISIDIQSNPWRITISHDSVTVDVSHASTAERVWTTAAFQATIARRTDARVFALDELGMLDGVQRRRLYAWAMKLDVQSIIVSAAQDTRDGQLVRPTDPGRDSIRVYWVENGTVQAVSREKAGASA